MKKLENNLDNQHKFFAQYWGQNVLCGGDNNTININCHSLNFQYSSDFLVLKSLSNITLEDAIDVASIFGQIHSSTNYEIRSKTNTSFTKEHQFRQLYVRNPQFDENFNINYDDSIIANFSDENSISLLQSNRDTIYLLSFDLLRSKGYAVPYMGLTVEELIEVYQWIQLEKL